MAIFSKRKINSWLLAAAIGGTLLIGVPVLERATAPSFARVASGNMSLTVFDIGQGDAILAQVGDKQILIDGGPSDRILEKLGNAMPVGDRTIELVVLTHPHSDHVTGLAAVVKQYAIGRIMKTDAISGSAVDRDFDATIKENNIQVDDPARVAVEQIGDMAYQVLHYEEQNEIDKKHKGSDDGLNDSSIVGMLSFKGKKFLLMGDATMAVEDILPGGIHADFIKIGHHGSAYSTGEKFLSAVAPSYAAISLGANNSYGFPAWRVRTLLEQSGIEYFRTDQNGDIVAVTDGQSLQVTAERVR